MNERKWKSGSGDRQRPVEFVQEKFTWQKRESVIEWIGWLFWTGCWGWKVKSRLNISSQIVYLKKTTECDKIKKLVTARRKEKKTIWTSVHKMFTWQKLLNVIYYKSCSTKAASKVSWKLNNALQAKKPLKFQEIGTLRSQKRRKNHKGNCERNRDC